MELGYLQLCADRRFHYLTMTAFEEATGLEPEQYWIEARSGGAPAYADRTRAARFAYHEGASHFGWAAHGDVCRDSGRVERGHATQAGQGRQRPDERLPARDALRTLRRG